MKTFASALWYWRRFDGRFYYYRLPS